VVCVSRNDAKAYIAWLNAKLDASQLAGRDGPYRLPSEAEWEYAARGGRRSERWWGNSLGQNHANCSVCSSAWDRKGTSPVGSFDANPFGLYDMLGNVDQLVEDCWNGSYAGAPSDGTAWESKTCGDHVTRGSDWQSDARQIRSDYRSYLGTDDRDNTIDFRVAKTIR
jgi:formylglycine-generating enzyme required for sulfatase activity